MGQSLVTNPGGLAHFILGLNVKSQADFMARINVAYPRAGVRELKIAFELVGREIRRAAPYLAARARDPEHGKMFKATIERHRALLSAMDPKSL
jgi:hypothetical protein